jgi:acid phosphatase (class A)
MFLMRSSYLLLGFLAGMSGLTAETTDEKALPPWKLPPSEWFIKRIPPPPAANSGEERADVAEVIKLQAAATPAQIAKARWTLNLNLFTFGEALGDKKFTPAHFPRTARFFRELNNLIAQANDPLKAYYRRPHPFEVDPVHIRRLVDAPARYSYPSFHSERCVVFAHVLTILDPDGKDLFQRVLKQVELDRVMAGEHFPSDIRTGNKVGELIYQELEKDRGFSAAVHELKDAEWTPPPRILKDPHILVP